jgi:hypothetical protein
MSRDTQQRRRSYLNGAGMPGWALQELHTTELWDKTTGVE